MRDWIPIGSSPSGEDCIQVGSKNYYEEAKKECKRFIEEIRRVCGPEPEDSTAVLRIKSNPHDFGTYYEVICEFDSEDEIGIDYAYFVEGNSPEFWNEPDLSRKWEKSLTLSEVKEILKKEYNDFAGDMYDVWLCDKTGYYNAPRFIKEDEVVKFINKQLETA